MHYNEIPWDDFHHYKHSVWKILQTGTFLLNRSLISVDPRVFAMWAGAYFYKAVPLYSITRDNKPELAIICVDSGNFDVWVWIEANLPVAILYQQTLGHG